MPARRTVAAPLSSGFPDRLRQVRQERGVTQEALATALAYSGKQSVGHLETGHTHPTIQLCEGIAAALGCSAAWLAYGVEPQDVGPQ